MSLQKHWQTRFRSEYFAISKHRYADLMSGSLKEVAFSVVASDGLGVWTPKQAVEVSEVEGDAQFEPGQ